MGTEKPLTQQSKHARVGQAEFVSLCIHVKGAAECTDFIDLRSAREQGQEEGSLLALGPFQEHSEKYGKGQERESPGKSDSRLRWVGLGPATLFHHPPPPLEKIVQMETFRVPQFAPAQGCHWPSVS